MGYGKNRNKGGCAVNEIADKGDKTGAKKQVPLRLSAALYGELAAWAEDEFRSVNGQIEYLLTECVKRRKCGGGKEKA